MSYWYQSTSSVMGMTGTSLSITCSSWSTMLCCVAMDVVAAYASMSLSVLGVGVPLPVGGGELADRSAVGAVEQLAQLVIRTGATRLKVVRQLVLAGVKVAVKVRPGQVVGGILIPT